MKKKLKLCVSPFVMAATVMLTGCGQYKVGYDYDASKYYIVYVDGEPHLTIGRNDSTDTLFNVHDGFYDDAGKVWSNGIAQFSAKNEKSEMATYSSAYYSPLFSIINVSNLVATNTFTQELYDVFSKDSEATDKFIEDNYLYDVVYSINWDTSEYSTPLGIYEFNNTLNDQTDCHIGYNANVFYDCDYVYDIKENKVFHKPDTGSYEFTPISDFYDGEQITATEAYQIMVDYISQKENGTAYTKTEE